MHMSISDATLRVRRTILECLSGYPLRGFSLPWRDRPAIVRGKNTLLVVVQHPQCRGLEVVELTPIRRPHERSDGHRDDEQRDRHHDVEHAHAGLSTNVRACHELSTTVSELAGMRIAATSGLIDPVIASAAPARLYASENARLRLITPIVRSAPRTSSTSGASPGLVR